VWFLEGGVPAYMRARPRGAAVWDAVHALRSQLAVSPPTMVHVDYWSGNILWVGDRISAVVDWEEAGYGDPAVDVAYCVMELALEGFDVAVADFIDEYVRTSGRRVDNLATGSWPPRSVRCSTSTPGSRRRRWRGGSTASSSWRCARRADDAPQRFDVIRSGATSTAVRRSAAITRSYSSQSLCVPPAAVKTSRSSGGTRSAAKPSSTSSGP
jgi:hypothetical protein